MTPLHYIGEALRNLFLMIPIEAAHVLFVALPVVLLVWVLRLPKEETSSPDGANLKVWAVLALLFQIVIYLVL